MPDDTIEATARSTAELSGDGPSVPAITTDPAVAGDPINETVEVMFRFDVRPDAGSVVLVAEFNDWSTTTHPMDRDDDGYVTVVVLAPGRTYRYKFLVDGTDWENDWHADTYQVNSFGGHDSVLDLTDR